jgi:D-beta-D-heptose 7-phosphate kinase/D-beta-D-heptose 1-phosphate adenosyltransferase
MAASYIEIVENLGRPRVLVVGDIMVDRYVWGNAERISQEAPVLLLRADRREERLGGAASVASMLATLGARVSLAGVLGNDETGWNCRSLLNGSDVEHLAVLADTSRPTTLKERYIGRAQAKHPQQVLRVDYEVRNPISSLLADRLAESILGRLSEFDIALVSDYDKGVCTPRLLRRLIDECRGHGLRVLVDPIRGGNYVERYHGSSAMTPNRLEATQATGIEITDIESAFEAAGWLLRELEMEVGVITLDRDGMVLVDREGDRRHFPVRPRAVYDITGAGDMVLAVMGMVLAAGYSFSDAIVLANAAGGLEVERVGVTPITRDEMIRDLRRGAVPGGTKVVSPITLARELEEHRRRGRSIAFANGCFDVLHAGHIHFLREARAQCDLLVVGLNSDASVRRLGKGPGRPINEQSNRAAVLSALECVDYVCFFDDDTPLELIRQVRPNVLVKGSDYRLEEVVGREFVESIGGRVHLAEYIPGRSTTALIEQISARRPAA